MDEGAQPAGSEGSLTVDPDFVERTAVELVRIPSVNPDLGDEGAGEARIADHVERLMRSLGLEVVRLEAREGRPSVVGIVRGGAGPSLMLNAHLDTVGVAGMPAPFSGTVDDGRLRGRGAFDMKGALASCIAAARALSAADAPPPGDVLVAAVADEETESRGTREVLESFRPDYAIVTEPSGLDLCVAHKGFIWLEARTEGRPAHGSRPDLGVDANLRMVRALAQLPSYARELEERRSHPLLGVPSIHVGRLDGGEGPSTYASASRAVLERRTLPGDEENGVLEEVRAVVGDEAEMRLLLARSPFEANPEGTLARATAAAAEQLFGRSPRQVGEGPWTDAALLAEAGVETVVFGPRGGGAHADDEWVDLGSLVSLARILADVPARLSGG